jgi:hypothetical protein
MQAVSLLAPEGATGVVSRGTDEAGGCRGAETGGRGPAGATGAAGGVGAAGSLVSARWRLSLSLISSASVS